MYVKDQVPIPDRNERIKLCGRCNEIWRYEKVGVVVFVVQIRNSERTSDPRRPSSYVLSSKSVFRKDETRIDHQSGQAVDIQSLMS